MSLRSHATQRTVFVFVICAVLFLVLRLRWVGHLLTWDEAYNLCTVRTFVSGGEDFASDWFWRHPPLFCLLMMLVSPLSPGFAERVEILAIFVGLANLALLFVLNRQAFDTTTALWSVFLLSILPGSMFFDVWVKRDHLATTFGLIALILLFRKHSLYAGVSLGLALLCKESAAFFVIAALVLWGLGATGRRKISDCIALVAFTFLSCSWWYLVVKSKLHPMDTSQAAPFLHVLFAGVKEHLQFAGGEQSIWVMPWYDYFSKLPFLIGIPGLLLAGVGIVAILKTGRAQHPARVHPEESFSPRRRLWPIALLVPAYVLLSLLPAKVPWLAMVLLPSWATLQAVGVTRVVAAVKAKRGNSPSRNKLAESVPVFVTICVIVLASSYLYIRHYEDVLKKVSESMWIGSSYSRESADAVNEHATSEDRVLVTSFYYWHNIDPREVCPVFVYYLSTDPAVLPVPRGQSFEKLVEAVKRNEIDWALLSPSPGENARDVFGGFVDKLGLEPHKVRGAWLFDTTSLVGGHTEQIRHEG